MSTFWAQYSGSLSLLNLLMPRIFWIHFGGSSITKGGISVDALQAAQENDFGDCLVHDPSDLINSKSIVVWGRNPAVTNVHLVPFIRGAQKRGASLTVVDPRYSETARFAEHHISPRPGADGYLAIALAKEIYRRTGKFSDSLGKTSVGLEGYLSLLDAYDPMDLLRKTDLGEEAITHLASCYSEHKPCATFLGLGVNWWKQGGANCRLIHSLIYASGNIGIPGGGANFFNLAFPFSTRIFEEEKLKAVGRGVEIQEPRKLLLPLLGEEIQRAHDPNIRVAWISMFNPVASAPDSNNLRDCLRKLDFVIVTEQFMTETAKCSDIILPATTYLEEDDVMYSHGNHYMGPVTAAVPPRGEARSNMRIFQELSSKLGFGEALDGEPWEWIARTWRPLEEQGISMEAVRSGPVRRKQPIIPYSDEKFHTADGKFHFITEYDETENEEAGFFLNMVKIRSFLNTQILEKDAPELPFVYVNSFVMKKMGINYQEHVWVYNAQDRLEAIARSSETTRRDVV